MVPYIVGGIAVPYIVGGIAVPYIVGGIADELAKIFSYEQLKNLDLLNN